MVKKQLFTKTFNSPHRTRRISCFEYNIVFVSENTRHFKKKAKKFFRRPKAAGERGTRGSAKLEEISGFSAWTRRREGKL
jgi:hypothetical protein